MPRVLSIALSTVIPKEADGKRASNVAVERLQDFMTTIAGHSLVDFDGTSWDFGGHVPSEKQQKVLDREIQGFLSFLTRRYTKAEVLVCIYRFPHLWKKFWVHRDRISILEVDDESQEGR